MLNNFTLSNKCLSAHLLRHISEIKASNTKEPWGIVKAACALHNVRITAIVIWAQNLLTNKYSIMFTITDNYTYYRRCVAAKSGCFTANDAAYGTVTFTFFMYRIIHKFMVRKSRSETIAVSRF